MRTSKDKPLTIVAIVQFAPVIGDVCANISALTPLLDLAFTANVVVLPELASSGYCFNSREEALTCAESAIDGSFVKFLISKAKQHHYIIASGINELDNGKLYNSSVLVNKDGVIGIYRKLHLFDNEKLIFEPGNLGLPVFVTEFGKIGMLVCYDWMFSEPWRVLALKGAQLICHPSNLVLPFCQTFLPTHSYVNGLAIASSNRVGEERGVQFRGESIVVNAKGEVVAQAGYSSEILWCELDLSAADDKKVFNSNNLLRDRRSDVYGNLGV